MAYPKVSHTAADDAAPASPSSPRSRRSRRRCSPSGRTTTPSRPSVEQRDAGRGRRQRVRLLRRPAVRQRPAALRPPADRLRQGPRAALPDHARPAGRAPLRLGHPRPARRARGDAPARHQDDRRDRRAGHRDVQRGVPQVGAASTPRSGRTTSPARPAGSTSRTTTRPSTSTTWRASSGRSSTCYDKGLAYEGFRVLPYCWNDETPLSNHELRMDDDVYQMRQDPAGHRRLRG